MDEENKRTIFNDPDKLKRTKENLANYFKPGVDYGEKLKGLLGINSAQAGTLDDQKARLARKMVGQ